MSGWRLRLSARALRSTVARLRARRALEVVIHEAPDRARYEALVGRNVAGYASYDRQPGLVMLLHTEIAPRFRGRGVASTLLRELLGDIRRNEELVLPVCPFVRGYLRRHRAYADLIWKP